MPPLNPFAATVRTFIIREQASQSPALPTISGLRALYGTEQGLPLPVTYSTLVVVPLLSNYTFSQTCRFINWSQRLFTNDPVDLYAYHNSRHHQQYATGRTRSTAGTAGSGSDADVDESNEHVSELESILRRRQRRFSAFVNISGLVVSSTVVASVLHPLSVVQTWNMTKLPPGDVGIGIVSQAPSLTIRETLSNIMSHPGKSLWDGLLPSISLRIIDSVVFSLLQPLVMRMLPGLSDHEHLERVKHAESAKRMLILTVRHITKMTVSSCISRFLIQILTFPLATVRFRLEAQGSSFLIPVQYEGTVDCATAIQRDEGLRGFYKGFPAHLLSIIPDLLFTGLTYATLVLILEYVYHEAKLERQRAMDELSPTSDDTDDDEQDSSADGDDGDDDDDDDDDDNDDDDDKYASDALAGHGDDDDDNDDGDNNNNNDNDGNDEAATTTTTTTTTADAAAPDTTANQVEVPQQATVVEAAVVQQETVQAQEPEKAKIVVLMPDYDETDESGVYEDEESGEFEEDGDE
jgi:hypothetical protein